MDTSENWNSKYRHDPRSTDELIELALTKDMDADDEGYWHPVRSLQYRLSAISDTIQRLLDGREPKARETAADILGQNSVKDKWEVRSCSDSLVLALKKEEATNVMASILHALGSLNDLASIDAILPFRGHPDTEVRYAVVHALSGHDDPRAICALIELSSDPDFAVRNWATFGLGSQTEADSSEIRDALLSRLGEEDAEIRGEALVGLANRGDPGVIEPLLRELNTAHPDILRGWVLAGEMADAIIRVAMDTRAPRWTPILQKLRALEIGETALVEAAINKCSSLRKCLP